MGHEPQTLGPCVNEGPSRLILPLFLPPLAGRTDRLKPDPDKGCVFWVIFSVIEVLMGTPGCRGGGCVCVKGWGLKRAEGRSVGQEEEFRCVPWALGGSSEEVETSTPP